MINSYPVLPTSLTIDTSRAKERQRTSSVMSAPSERPSLSHNSSPRPLSASAGVHTRNFPAPGSPMIIDLTDDDQGPSRKKAKVTETGSIPTSAQHDSTPQPWSASVQPHAESSTGRRSPVVQNLPSVSSSSLLPDQVPGEATSTQTAAVSKNGNTNEPVDVNYKEFVDAIIEEPDSEGKRLCKLCRQVCLSIGVMFQR
jgi:hypothetical protein